MEIDKINENILYDLFKAYYDARKNKRNTINQLNFEINLEKNIITLADKIIKRQYTPNASICFIVNKPVKREVFAADFRDRVIHHYIFNNINQIFDKLFIHDSYSCRKGKGTHYGINRIDHFIRSCSQNYTMPCYILKLDIKGYFMSINKNILFEKIMTAIEKNKDKIYNDYDILIYLIKKTIFNDPTKNCIIKGKKSDWDDLPKSKSLFYAKKDCGLPIGNLTSQLFANIYLNDFDHYVKNNLGIKYYGRYVDDFILIHRDADYLKFLIPFIREYLSENLQLELHPNKIYFQSYEKGVKFLGAVIMPYRIYIANRTKANFYDAIKRQNILLKHNPLTYKQKINFLNSMNSYLGIMQHYKTYKMRKNMLFRYLDTAWWQHFYLVNNAKKIKMSEPLIFAGFDTSMNALLSQRNKRIVGG